MENNPNKKYDHVYVVLRYDTFIELGGTRVSVLKVFVNEDDAKQEVNRLNNLVMKRESLQKGKGLISSTYSYQIGRIQKGELLHLFNNFETD
jgi:hypothetical protein